MAQGENAHNARWGWSGEDGEHAVRSETAFDKDSDIVVTGHRPHEATEP